MRRAGMVATGTLALLASCVGAAPPAPGMTEGTSSDSMSAGSSGPGVDTGTTVVSGPGSSGVVDGSTTTGASSSDDGDGSSGTTGGLPAWPTEAFGDPVLVSVSTQDAEDDDPSLTGDQLELFFSSLRSGDEDIYWATRARLDADWSDPIAVDSLNSTGVDATPEVSNDGLRMMFVSNRAGPSDVYFSARKTREDPWEPPIYVEALSTPDTEASPTLTYGLDRVYWCSNRPDGGGGSRDIWTATIEVDADPVSTGRHVPMFALNTGVADCSPFVSPDERVVVFDSFRNGSSDLWMATRAEPEELFGAPELVAGVNLEDFFEGDPWVSPDGRVIYFTSSRDGSLNIYRAER